MKRAMLTKPIGLGALILIGTSQFAVARSHTSSAELQSLFTQCAAQTAGAQSSTLQTAYQLSADVQTSLKQCMRDARDTQELKNTLSLASCTQSGGATVDAFRSCRSQLRAAQSLSGSAGTTSSAATTASATTSTTGLAVTPGVATGASALSQAP